MIGMSSDMTTIKVDLVAVDAPPGDNNCDNCDARRLCECGLMLMCTTSERDDGRNIVWKNASGSAAALVENTENNQ